MLLPRLAKVATSVVSVAAVMAQPNLASPAFWAERQAALYVVIVVLVGVALTEVYGSVFDYARFSTVRRFDQELQAVLSAGISKVGRDAAVNWRSTRSVHMPHRAMPHSHSTGRRGFRNSTRRHHDVMAQISFSDLDFRPLSSCLVHTGRGEL